jgi:hypothetical protein
MSWSFERASTRIGALVTIVAVLMLPPNVGRAQDCGGDCDGNGSVGITELIRGVNIALGVLGIDVCRSFDTNGDDEVRVNELIVAVNNALNGCPASDEIVFVTPTDGLMVLAGTVAVMVTLPDGSDLDTTVVVLDDDNVTDELSIRAIRGARASGIVEGNLLDVTAGRHELRVSVEVDGLGVSTPVQFEAIDLNNPDECEVLNNAECLLPYPSSRFISAPFAESNGNGVRLEIPQVGIPVLNGPPVPAEPLNELDGFSPVVQILMHFPQGVDPEQFNASRLLPPSEPGPPWIDTRTHDGRSLDEDSPTILLEVESGERILHFIENDAHATKVVEGETVPDLERMSLIMRPGESLKPGLHYIVAMRKLKDALGDDIVAERAFAALRDGLPTNIDAIEDRRGRMEAMFTTLGDNGIGRDDLVLVFGFQVRSEYQLTHVMLSMRDQAYEWLEQIEADSESVTFTVNGMTENDCDKEGQAVFRTVSGTYQSPLFLDGSPDEPGVQFLNLVGGEPTQNGFMDAVYDITIPCTVLDTEVESYPLILGHGLFGTPTSMTRGIPEVASQVVEWNYIGGATFWRGLSSPDLVWVVNDVIGVGSSQLHNFPALPDRLKQGMLNTLVLARMMKRGLFNRDAAFRLEDEGIFPGPETEMFYYGISLGGIMGTWFSALTPDVERFGVDVPSINFSCLLQRSTQFGQFETLLESSGLVDAIQTILGLQLTHELWVASEPAGFARHITSDPLPGSGGPSRILMTPAWLDKQVSNQCTEISARTLGLANLQGSLVEGLQGIPDLPGPLDSAYVMYDTGSFDLFDPDHQEFIPPLANLIPSSKCDPHGQRPSIPASIRQLTNFMRPGGRIENFCNGICDAGDPSEWRLNPEGPCDPLD